MEVETGMAKVRIRFKIREIPVYHLEQQNCIYVEPESSPDKWTKATHKQSQCVTIINQRKVFSDRQDPPIETKMFRVPANKYIKVRVTISDKMANRQGEKFGFQIVTEAGRTVLTQGGWRPGETKTSKAFKLKPGRYYWRCPANPTPWYGLIAE